MQGPAPGPESPAQAQAQGPAPGSVKGPEAIPKIKQQGRQGPAAADPSPNPAPVQKPGPQRRQHKLNLTEFFVVEPQAHERWKKSELLQLQQVILFVPYAELSPYSVF